MSSQVVCSSETILQLKLYARQLHTFVREYKDLIDSYVVEFFVKKRWAIFPESWQKSLDGCTPDEVANLLLDHKMNPQQSVLPLSLLAYRAATRALALDPRPTVEEGTSIKMDPAFKPVDLLCRLHVKAKKRHEILRLAEVIHSASKIASTDRVVDVGSGQGHLSRLLSFGYDLKVTSIEAVGCHLTGAAKVDTKIKTIIQKRIKRQSSQQINGIPHTPPQQVECTVHSQITVGEFLNVINSQSANSDKLDQSNNDSTGGIAHSPEGQNGEDKLCENKSAISTNLDNFSNETTQTCHREEHKIRDLDFTVSDDKKSDTFVIAGLHTCGDLAPTMLRVFSKCPQARALTSVACCYMRMKCAITNEAPSSLKNSSEAVQNRTTRKIIHSSCSQNSSLLLRDSSLSPQVSAIGDGNHVGQEYSNDILQNRMKDSNTSCSDHDSSVSSKGYPMSQFVDSLGESEIHFEALELACHSLASYRQRLKDRNPNLILHGYRSTLEMIIQEHDREMTQTHTGICKIKKAVASIRKPHLKSFQEYATSALSALHIPFKDDHLAELEAKYRPEWNNVITFHVLRSMLGPIVESLLLIDRVLFLFEQGIESRLVPVFDASLSPRNFALVAIKDS